MRQFPSTKIFLFFVLSTYFTYWLSRIHLFLNYIRATFMTRSISFSEGSIPSVKHTAI